MFYCLLFIHVNMYIYIMYIFIKSLYCYYYVDIESGFRVSIRVSGIRGFGFGEGLLPESVFGSVSGFDRVSGSGAHRLRSIRTRSVAILIHYPFSLVFSPYK